MYTVLRCCTHSGIFLNLKIGVFSNALSTLNYVVSHMARIHLIYLIINIYLTLIYFLNYVFFIGLTYYPEMFDILSQ